MKLKLEDLDKIFITSDTHFGHANICRGTTTWDLTKRTSAEGNVLGVRDFDTIEEMNRALIDGINSTVPDDGILFHLGDWSFGGEDNIRQFRHRINCDNINLITGNHDHHQEKGTWDHLFTSRQKYLELEVGKHLKFNLFHFPIVSWNNINRGSFHLHGHQHWSGDKRFSPGRCMDVGVDGNNLCPYKLTDVIDLLKDRKKYDPEDHHISMENNK